MSQGQGPGPDLDLNIADLARSAAETLRERDLFGETRLFVPSLIQRLGLELNEVAGLGVEAKLERRRRISVRAELPYLRKRFAIMHEIGHAVFWNHFEDIARTADRRAHEEFAGCFAVSMLLPVSRQEQLKQTLRNSNDAEEILRIENALGLSIDLLLTVIGWNPEWLAGSAKVWMHVKLMPNRFTHQEIKLRIASAAYDRDQWFIPTNRGFAGIFGDAAWLSALSPGMMGTAEAVKATVQQMNPSGFPKFRTIKLPAQLNAFCLKPATSDGRPHLLVLANLENTKKIIIG